MAATLANDAGELSSAAGRGAGRCGAGAGRAVCVRTYSCIALFMHVSSWRGLVTYLTSFWTKTRGGTVSPLRNEEMVLLL